MKADSEKSVHEILEEAFNKVKEHRSISLDEVKFIYLNMADGDSVLYKTKFDGTTIR